MVVSTDPDFKLDVNRTKRDFEVVHLLQQQDTRKLFRIYETEVGGESRRTYIYEYLLPDGRVKRMSENKRGEGTIRKGKRVSSQEVWDLISAGKAEVVGTTVESVDGRVFGFVRYRMTLADGREVVHSIGKPMAE